MDDLLSGFYSRLLKEISESSEPPPDRTMFDAVFAMLSLVKDWKPAKKVGKRIYDDRAFVESVKAQADEGSKPLTLRQLQSLVRVALWYHDQIPDCDTRLAAAGLAPQKTTVVSFADQDMVKYCLSKLDAIPELKKNKFLVSVREQADHGRGLSRKQLAIVARAILEKIGGRPDEEEVRKKLAEFDVPEFGAEDIAAGEMLEMLKSVKSFRPPTRYGKRVYDDKTFFESLADQYARRHTLSDRQVGALKRVVYLYRDQIPDYEAKKEALGLEAKKEKKPGGPEAE